MLSLTGNVTTHCLLPLTLPLPFLSPHPTPSPFAFIPSNSIPGEHLHEERDGLRIARRRKRDVDDDRQTPDFEIIILISLYDFLLGLKIIIRFNITRRGGIVVFFPSSIRLFYFLLKRVYRKDFSIQQRTFIRFFSTSKD